MLDSTNVLCDPVKAQEGADYVWQVQIEKHLKCTRRRRERPEVQSTHAGHVEKHPRADEDTPENELDIAKTDREAPEVHGA